MHKANAAKTAATAKTGDKAALDGDVKKRGGKGTGKDKKKSTKTLNAESDSDEDDEEDVLLSITELANEDGSTERPKGMEKLSDKEYKKQLELAVQWEEEAKALEEGKGQSTSILSPTPTMHTHY